MSFKVGQKVVCVDDNFDLSDPIVRKMVRPVKDITYTVRESDDGMVYLEEIINDQILMDLGGINTYVEPGFASIRFAPLLDDRDSMTENMLNDLMLDVEEYEYLEVEETELV